MPWYPPKRRLTAKDFHDFVKGRTWTYAKTMPQWPHDYTLRKTWETDEQFDDVVMFIREHGVEENS